VSALLTMERNAVAGQTDTFDAMVNGPTQPTDYFLMKYFSSDIREEATVRCTCRMEKTTYSYITLSFFVM
jgi:hypothetical protein